MTTHRISDLLVEKVHLGEASEAERALVLADPDARARLEALPASDAAFHAAMPVDQEWPKIEARARIANARDDVRSNRAAMGSIVFAPLLAVLLAVLWVGPMSASNPGTGPEQTNVKGDNKKDAPKLRVYRKRAAGSERVGTGIVARAGDVFQLGTVSKADEHGVIVSVDGRGGVTLHWPEAADKPTTLPVGENPLPSAYTLDDAPEFERFFLVTTGNAPTDVGTVIHAAEALAASGTAASGELAVPKSYTQSSFVVRKEVR